MADLFLILYDVAHCSVLLLIYTAVLVLSLLVVLRLQR